MIDQAKIKLGDKVHYQPSHFDKNEYENGIVKSVPEDNTYTVHVVYTCNGDWNNWDHYTGASTNTRDLHKGWKHE